MAAANPFAGGGGLAERGIQRGSALPSGGQQHSQNLAEEDHETTEGAPRGDGRVHFGENEDDNQHPGDQGGLEPGHFADLENNDLDTYPDFDHDIDQFGFGGDQDPEFLKRQQEEYEKYQQMFQSKQNLNAQD